MFFLGLPSECWSQISLDRQDDIATLTSRVKWSDPWKNHGKTSRNPKSTGKKIMLGNGKFRVDGCRWFFEKTSSNQVRGVAKPILEEFERSSIRGW